jgi:sodium/pantothenate symporter
VNDPIVSPGYGALAGLLLVIGVSLWLGALAQKTVSRSSFLTGYFLGNRGLGAWALALTATVQSGGTFMGYPSLIYTHGWIVGLWIASYMIVPLTGFAVLGKRFAQLSHRTGAITVPDLFRARFASPRLGLAASLLIIFFMSFMMIAQFKAGAIVMKLSWPHSGALALAEDSTASIDTGYLVGLAIFSVTVVGYTLVGGFLASVWTDLFQSVLMAIGVVVLFLLVVPTVSHADWSQAGWGGATQQAVAATGPAFASGPGFSSGAHSFLPPTLALSYFFVWIFGGVGQPAGMIRVMAAKNTQTLRRSVVLLSFYNLLIYLPLLVICVCARSIFPSLENSDELIPRLALWATRDIPGGSLVSGLILAAPFGAVMSTVSSYLVVLAAGIVRDVYQHFFRPGASENEIRRASHLAMILLGTVAVAANLHPVRYLQALVVFSTAGCASTFAVPALMMAYWRRATAAGAAAAMTAGATTVLGLFAAGLLLPDQQIDQHTSFHSYYPWGYHPVIFGLAASALAGVVVSLLSTPPPESVLAKLFSPLDAPTRTVRPT